MKWSLLALVAYAEAQKTINRTPNPDTQRFMMWAAQNNRVYTSYAEARGRQEQWARNDAAFAALNADHENTFTVGHNQFSDWTPEEYAAILTLIPQYPETPD